MRANFGIDAPGLLVGFALVGSVLGAVSLGLIFGLNGVWWSRIGVAVGLIALYPLGMAALMLYDSLHTKIATAEMLLSQVNWTGTETVLDVGCGRGLMLIRAARRLTIGTATGIDLWRAQDQASNRPEKTLENARIEGVADKVRVETGDMRDLPFPDGHFDVVLSNWTVHNLDEQQDRARALAEMLRVLRPGGTLIVSDIVNRDEYHQVLSGLGLSDLRIVVASDWRDAVLRTVSFGSYQPAAIVGQRPIASVA